MIMRLLLIAFLAIVPLSSIAQWKVGIIGGAVYNMYTTDEHYLTDFRNEGAWGGCAGIAAQYAIKRWSFLNSDLNVRAEVSLISKSHYSIRGYKDIAYSESLSENRYAQIPIMANYGFGGEKLRTFLNIGGYIGWNTINNDFPFMRAFSFGGVEGIGTEYRIWALTLQAEARAYLDALSVTKHEGMFRTPHYNTTIVFQINVLYNL